MLPLNHLLYVDATCSTAYVSNLLYIVALSIVIWIENLNKMIEEDIEMDCVLRPINCEINLLSRSDGSTMFMQGIRIL